MIKLFLLLLLSTSISAEEYWPYGSRDILDARHKTRLINRILRHGDKFVVRDMYSLIYDRLENIKNNAVDAESIEEWRALQILAKSYKKLYCTYKEEE